MNIMFYWSDKYDLINIKKRKLIKMTFPKGMSCGFFKLNML